MAEVTTQELRAIFSGDATSFQNAVDKAEKSMGSVLSSSRRASKAFSGMADSFIMGGDAATVAATSILDLGKAFKVGFAPLLVAGIGAGIVKEFKEMQKEGERLDKVLDGLGNHTARGTAQSMGDITKEIEGSKKALEEFQKQKDHIDNSLMGGFVSGSERIQNNLRIKAAQDEIYKGYEKQADKEYELLEIERTRADLGERAAQRQTMLSKHAEEQQKAQTENPDFVYQDSVKQKDDLELSEFDRKTDFMERESQHAENILAIRKKGADVEQKTADENLKYWNKEIQFAGRNTELLKKATEEQEKAEQVSNKTKVASTVKMDELRLQVQIAQLTGSADQKHIAAKKLEIEMLEKILKLEDSEKAPETQVKIAQAEAQKGAAEQTAREKNLSVDRTVIQAETQNSPEGQLLAMKEQLAITKLLNQEKEKSKQVDAADIVLMRAQEEIEQKAIKAKTLELAMKDIQFGLEYDKIAIEEKSESTARKKYETTQLELKAVNEEIAAQEKLNGSVDEGLKIKATSLQASLNQQGLKAFTTPGQQGKSWAMAPRAPQTSYGSWVAAQQAQNKQDRADASAITRAQNNDFLVNVKRDMNGNIIGGIDPSTGLPPEPGDPRAQAGDPLDRFQKGFQAKQDQKNKAVADDKATRTQQMKDQQKNKGESPEVKVLEQIKTKIDDLVLR